MAELVQSKSENSATHVEGDKTTAVHRILDNGLLKSSYDELSVPRTVWVFKRVVLVSIAVYTGYVCEGFEVSEMSHISTTFPPNPLY